ncbi:MAG: aspartate/glutamate racemase family protein [Pseudomonadota bacterium]
MRPVGILGGMGPEATILLMQKVLGAVDAADDADHVPLIVHQNPAVPSRIAALIDGDGADPGPVLAQMAQDLSAAGARALAMPCNTAHHYAGAIGTDLPFLDMITATGAALAGQGRIGILASPAVRLTGAFDRAGLDLVYPEDDAPLLGIIKAVKAGQPPAPLNPIAAALMARSDHLLIACTELSLLAQDLPDHMPWTDSLDILTGEIVAFARG